MSLGNLHSGISKKTSSEMNEVYIKVVEDIGYMNLPYERPLQTILMEMKRLCQIQLMEAIPNNIGEAMPNNIRDRYGDRY